MVHFHLGKLTDILPARGVHLTERELALLAVSVTEMKQARLDPYIHRFIVQVVPGLEANSLLFCSYPRISRSYFSGSRLGSTPLFVV